MLNESAISSRAANGGEVPRGLSLRLHTLSGARAVRVIERPNSSIGEHAHDWPVLSLYVMGSCTRSFEREQAEITGPCAVLHPPGEFHSSSVGAFGLEQIDIEFDPAWLRLSNTGATERVKLWRGGALGDATRRLSALWTYDPGAETRLSRATRAFVQLALTSEPSAEPNWLDTVLERVNGDRPPTTVELARDLDLHPAWLAQAYRAATGEGLQQTLMRKRVERAALLLRNTADPAAEIAAECGFCDQSHMIRCFKQLLSRTPSEIRSEAEALLKGNLG